MPRMTVEFDGFSEVINRLQKLEADVRKTTDEALINTKKIIHKEAGAAMSPHNKSYTTVKSLNHNSSPEWKGSTASISVGFDIKNGGLPSIFLMYGTPRMKKDQKLYNAFFGRNTQYKVRKAQEETFYDAIRRHESK